MSRTGMRIRIKRVYDAPQRGDGLRVLVDRLWPRGLPKERAKVDLWLKDIAPSAELRSWFGHDPGRWGAFQQKYRHELAGKAEQVQMLRKAAAKRAVTLLFAARTEDQNNAVVLKDVIEEAAR